MTDAMLEDVSRIEHITALKLGGSRSVTDAGVRHLSRLSRLRYLDLSGTRYHGSRTRSSAGAAGTGDGLVGLDEGHGRRGRAICPDASASATLISRALRPATVPSVHSRGRRACVN